jgi:hypothetical protein
VDNSANVRTMKIRKRPRIRVSYKEASKAHIPYPKAMLEQARKECCLKYKKFIAVVMRIYNR